MGSAIWTIWIQTRTLMSDAIGLPASIRSQICARCWHFKMFRPHRPWSTAKKTKYIPTIRRQVRAWLKSGWWMESSCFQHLRARQGGVISPLLACPPRDGRRRITQVADTYLEGQDTKRKPQKPYFHPADDFVILHEDLTVVQRCQQIIAEWLKTWVWNWSLQTRLMHTLTSVLKKTGV